MSFGAGQSDVYLIKTDNIGDTLWTKTYGGTSWDYGYSVQQTADEGYIITGHTQSFGAGNSDVYLVKTDANGNTLWTKTYGGTGHDRGRSVQQTADWGYIITGYTSSFGTGGDDVYLIKTDAIGNTLWTKTYGGTGHDRGRSVQQTADGGYIITGSTMSFGAGQGDVYLIKTDNIGDTLWTKTYGGTSWDAGRGAQQTTDGGYIITGLTTSFGVGLWSDVYLIKTDANGDILWTKIYGKTGEDGSSSVQQTADGGYIITGYIEDLGVSGDVYLIKTNSNGNTDCITENTTNTVVGNPSTIVGSGGIVNNTATIVNNPATIVNNTATVVTDIFSAAPQPICLITVDTTSTKNVIVWEKPITTGIDSFRIYREFTTDNYLHIGSVAYSDLSVYTDNDPVINPNTTSYRYKISVIDTCGNENALSDLHKTIHLGITTDINGKPFLLWTDYEGFPVTSYNILRDSTGLYQWEVIGTVGFGITSFTDQNPPQTSGLKYVVEVVSPDTCTATQKAENYNSSRSNTSTSVTGINEFKVPGLEFQVYPNPGTGKFTLETALNKPQNLQLKIFNILGQEIFSEELKQVTGILQKQLDLSSYSKGIYNLQLLSSEGVVNKKIVIE